MPLPITRSALDALGRRLRRPDVSADDWQLLAEVLRAYQSALDAAQVKLEALDLAPSSRVKTVTTLVDKLRRGSSLKSIQDVAGLRVVTEGGLSEQDRVVARLTALWPDGSIKDRRIEPT